MDTEDWEIAMPQRISSPSLPVPGVLTEQPIFGQARCVKHRGRLSLSRAVECMAPWLRALWQEGSQILTGSGTETTRVQNACETGWKHGALKRPKCCHVESGPCHAPTRKTLLCRHGELLRVHSLFTCGLHGRVLAVLLPWITLPPEI